MIATNTITADIARSLMVAVAAERVAALRVEIIELVSRAKDIILCSTSTRGRYDAAVAMVGWPEIHLALHLVDIFLGVFDHLDRLIPLLFESGLCLFYLLFLNLHPAINLLLLCLESARGELVLFEQLLYVLSFLLFLEFEDLFFELYELGVLTVLHYHIEFLL